MSEFDIIHELKQIPFSKRLYADQLQIVKKGRPLPALHDLKSEHKEKNRTYVRKFNHNIYIRYSWLAGSTTYQSLFCFSCLLFSSDSNPWNKKGFNNLNYITSACEKHQKSVSHLRAYSTFQTFGSQRVDAALDLQKKFAVREHNEKVKENRNVLKRLIDVVAYLGKQKCAFWDEDFKNKGMYSELLDLLANYDPVISNYLKTATIFNEAFPTILIDAIANAISQKIRSEICNATYVALALVEMADVPNKSQLATIIRFVDHAGSCQERFLNFTDVSERRTAQGIMKHITETVDDLNCSKKLIALTFDGAAVKAGHKSELLSLVKEKYSLAAFIHCHSHSLSLVLSKSTSSILECRRFFNRLSGIGNFFSHSSARMNALIDFMELKLPGGVPSQWNFSTKLTYTVAEYREALIKFFLSFEKDPDNWTGEEVSTATGFIPFLRKAETKFLLVIFSKIFSLSDYLFEILQKKCLDIVFCAEKVNDFCTALQKIKDNDFDHILEYVNVGDDTEDGCEPPLKKQKNDDSYTRYSNLFNAIFDNLMITIKLRFDSLKDLKLTSLLDSKNFPTYHKRFPQNLLAELSEQYASNFDLSRLKNELVVLYSSNEYKKSLHEIAHYLKLNNLDLVFVEVYKLLELVLTIPSTVASVETSFPALKRIKNHLRATQGHVQVSSLALISIEKDILLEMKTWDDEKFYENVMLKFAEKDKTMELLFK